MFRKISDEEHNMLMCSTYMAVVDNAGEFINKPNNMSKKTKLMEFDNTIVKLDRESYNNLKGMLSSSDKENHAVAFSVLENLNMKINLPYVLMLYKTFKDGNEDKWKGIISKIEKVLKALDKGKLDNVTFNNYWNILHKNYPVEEVQLIVDEYSKTFTGYVTNWGFPWLKHCDVIIKIRE